MNYAPEKALFYVLAEISELSHITVYLGPNRCILLSFYLPSFRTSFFFCYTNKQLLNNENAFPTECILLQISISDIVIALCSLTLD